MWWEKWRFCSTFQNLGGAFLIMSAGFYGWNCLFLKDRGILNDRGGTFVDCRCFEKSRRWLLSKYYLNTPTFQKDQPPQLFQSHFNFQKISHLFINHDFFIFSRSIFWGLSTFFIDLGDTFSFFHRGNFLRSSSQQHFIKNLKIKNLTFTKNKHSHSPTTTQSLIYSITNSITENKNIYNSL